MALVVESHSIDAYAGNRSTFDIVVPSGTVAGDLLIGHVTHHQSIQTLTSFGGGTYTEFSTQDTGDLRSHLFWKIAGSSEGNATVNFNVSAAYNGGALIRISGHDATTPVATSNYALATNTAAPSVNATITPSFANSLILFFVTSSQNDNTIGGYAIATDNPTWTEQYEAVQGIDNYGMSMAYAVRAAVTATGNSSLSGLDTTADTLVQMVAISPSQGTFVPKTIIIQ